MKTDAKLTAARLREVLDYDRDTGVFRWRTRLANCVQIGTVAGTVNAIHGYRFIQVDRQIHAAHRLAWLYVTGEWPTQETDHINGDRLDNRFDNLRSVSRAINMQNKRRAQRNNCAGLLGAHLNKRSGNCTSSIGVDGRQVYLGAFPTPEEAHAAYLEAKRRLHEGSTL